MTGERAGHREFDELAAGYALDALEPGDEQLFRTHLADCPDCARTLAGYRRTAAELAELAAPADPPARLGGRIRAAATAEIDAAPAAGVDATGAVVTLESRRRWPRPRWATAAAAAAVIAIGVGAGLAVTSSSSDGGPALAACAASNGCHRIVLTDAATHRTAAVVFVRGDTAYLQANGLPADNAAEQIYVLWQVTGQHTPLPVASFDVHSAAAPLQRLGVLAVPYRDTWAFAISLEPGRTIPSSPSRPVAVGSIAS